MIEPRLSSTELHQRIEQCRRDYEAVKAKVADVGFICEGSLVERFMPCGRPNCACASDRNRRHGPYYQLSWKEHGRTVSRRLSPKDARLYREWIANRRQLDSLLTQMKALSRQAGQWMLAHPLGAGSRVEDPTGHGQLSQP